MIRSALGSRPQADPVQSSVQASGNVRLLVVIGTLRYLGGAERQALYLVEHLSRLPKCEVHVLTFEDGPLLRRPLEALGVRVHFAAYYFRWPRSKRLRALSALAFRLRTKIRPDALLPFVGIHSKAMAMVWPYSGARFCWWNQQDEGRDLGGTKREGKILRAMPSITSNSVAGQEFLAATYGIPAQRIQVYNNGTPVPEVADLRLHWRSDLEIENRPMVTMVANLTRYKDHATLLEAWHLVQKHFASHSAQPVLLLAGHTLQTETVKALKIQAFDLGLSSDAVRMLGAVSDVQSLIAESDLVVHSSIAEGCPNSVCEAMALSRAVVATDIPGTRQALGDSGTAWLAPPRDAAGMAARIITLLEDADLRDRIGAMNRRRIEAEFTIDQMNAFFQSQIESGLGLDLGRPVGNR